MSASIFPASAGSFGQLTPNGGGCIAQSTNISAHNGTAGCSGGSALLGASSVAISPDGRTVYVASGYSAGAGWGAVAIFSRDPGSGALSQIGCVSSDATSGRTGSNGACLLAPGLLGADAVAVSPNGRTVYVAASRLGNVDAFNRDTGTGMLTSLRGCFVEVVGIGSQCVAARVFRQSTSVTAGTSSQYIYAGSAGRGAISQLPDTSFALASPLAPPPIFENACVSVAGPENTCVNGVAMNSVDALSLSRDGGTLYAASTASGAVDTFAVDPASGALTQTGCLMRNPPPGPCRASQLLDAPTAVAASPDGRTVYAADTGGSSGDRLVALLRDPATGQLRDGSCYDELPLPGSRSGAGAPDPCHSLPGLDNVQSVAVSPDSTTVYTVGDNALAVLVRDPATGQLIETACAVPLDQRCSDPVGLSGGRSVVASPDGMNIYAAAANAAAVTAWGQGASVTSGRASGALAYLTVSCPATSATHCMGMATLGRLAMWHASVTAISTRAQFVVAPGAVATVRVRLAQRLAKEAATGHVLVVQALVLPELGGGGGSSRTIALVPSR